MSEFKGNTEVKMGSDRSFGLVFATVFLVVALFPLIGGGEIRIWSLAIAASFLALSLAVPSILHQLNILWFRFGMFLHRIVSPVILGVLFFAVVAPIGLIRRSVKPDPLNQKLDPAAQSYWITVDQTMTPRTSMRKQF